MARTAYISSPPAFGAINVSAKTQKVEVTCEWDYNSADDHVRIGFKVGLSNPPSGETTYWYDTASGKAPGFRRDSYDYQGGGPESMLTDGGTTGSLLRRGEVTCDKTYYAQSVIDYWLDYDETTLNRRTSSVIGFKSNPIPFVCAAPTASNVTSSSAQAAFTYYPNTDASTAAVSLEYKKAADSTWTTAVTYTGQTGYSGIPKTGVNLTNLSASTLYYIRVTATRTTSSDTTFTSSSGSFTTLAGIPTITTEPATSIGTTSATLNGTAGPFSTDYDMGFQWRDIGGVQWFDTAVTYIPASQQTVNVSETLTGLGFPPYTVGTSYEFRARAVYNGGADTVYGSILTFTSAIDPGIIAKDQEMLPIQDFDRKYGVATTIFFVAPSRAATSSDLFYTGAAPWVGAEAQITKVVYDDDSTPTVTGPTTTASAPTQVSGSLYRLNLSAAEVQCDEAFITLTDAANAVRDILLTVRTHLQLGSVIVDSAAGSKANSTAMTLTGFGSGSGLQANAGATGVDIDAIIASEFLRVALVGANSAGAVQRLDANASGVTDYYKGCIIAILSGTGAGQARVIVSYNGSTKDATMDSAWATGTTTAGSSLYALLPGARPWELAATAELSAVPNLTQAKYGEMLQLLFQRFAFKITQDGTTQIWKKADGTTTFASRTVGDTGTEQSVGILS